MYYLTLANGNCIAFHLKSCAEIYQRCYGGRIVRDHSQKLLVA